MKYPCSVIQDLLPLYVDEVCSEESKTIVEEHLSQCSICKEIYDSMCNLKQEDIHDYHESQKIKSLKHIKKKILHKQILIGLTSIVLLFVLGFGIMTTLKNDIEIVKPDDRISVSMINGSLTTRLQSSRISKASIKRVSISSKNYLFFFVENSKWDVLTTNDEVYSELILCPEDKNADEIDAVYYFTGDYEGIESLNEKDLQKIIQDSKLLWTK
ncbi:MAG: zf-HC2 domain-containing protein [Floccifex sp.]